MSNLVEFKRALKHTVRPYLDKPPAVPFIKWAGGKRALMPSLARHFPERIGTYWEPFLGGAAVFFTIADRMDRAILSDTNEELAITYQVVKEQVDDLIEALRVHEGKHHQKAYYLSVRKQEPESALDIASRFIYLNKTCYNGLYRVNRKGMFNVPKGRYKSLSICNADSIRAASKVLSKATILLGDFGKIVQPEAGDFIYCDPPYDSCFNNYQSGGFTNEDQTRLREAISRWVSEGALVLASNSDTQLIRKLYRGKYVLHETQAPRPINSKASGRGDASELIITSYGQRNSR